MFKSSARSVSLLAVGVALVASLGGCASVDGDSPTNGGDEGSLWIDGTQVEFRRPQDARSLGIETVYQNLAVSPALDIAANIYLGREIRKRGILGSVFRALDVKSMRTNSRQELATLDAVAIMTGAMAA